MNNKPFKVKLKKNRNYSWCSCGLSNKEPFCNGAHSKVGLYPLIFSVENEKNYFLCGCKLTSNYPFCDGTHKNIVSND